MRQTIRRQFQLDFIRPEFDTKQRGIGNAEAADNVILALQYFVHHGKTFGDDLASRIVKSIRRIAQLRRRMGEVQQQIDAMQQAEIFHLKQTIEETEAMGGDPLGDLAKQLMQELSERKIKLEIARFV